MFLDEESQTPFYLQIFDQIRRNIQGGAHPAGGKLPSIRSLAGELQCSRNTVEAAYQMLVEEGYAASKPGSGYIVQDISHIDFTVPSCSAVHLAPQQSNEPEIHFDFNYGNLQAGTFPAQTWKTLTDDILLSVNAKPMDTYTDPLGELDLRAEVAWRLSMVRGVTCDPEQVIIQAGTQASIHNLLLLFDPQNDIIATEEPGYDAVRKVIERNRFQLSFCKVAGESADFVSDVEASQAKLVYVTPSSQFPTCGVMSSKRRERLIEWARKNDAYILEDDYCREFRYVARPLPPMHSMDPDRVIYMGTFSKSVSPALRVNYLVLPPRLLEKWNEIFKETYPPVPWLTQAVLTRFIRDGHRDRLLRKQQTRNKSKYETLVSTLEEYMGERVEVLKNGTGLHLLVNVLDGRPQEELINAAAEHGVRVYDTNRYWAQEDHALKSCVLVGFSAIPEEDIRPGIKALTHAWFGE